MAEMKINLSFKQHEKELYDFLKSQRSPSNYIKDAVDFYRAHGNGSVAPQKQNAPQQEEQIVSSGANKMLNF